MRATRWIAMCLLALIVLTQSVNAGQPKRVTSDEFWRRLLGGTPAYTESQAQAYAHEVLPLVEKVTGRRFKNMPTIKVVRSEDAIPMLNAELCIEFRHMHPHYRDWQIREEARSTARVYAKACLGFYGSTIHKLYLFPYNLQPLMDFAHISARYRQRIAELVVAHELTHALQDQQLGLAKLDRRVTSVDSNLALWSSAEGLAMLVQARVADRLGTSAAARELSRLMGATLPKSVDAVVRMAAQSRVGTTRDVYFRGLDFVVWQQRKGGIDRIWQILANPPRETSMIYRPETYSMAPAAHVDLSHALDGLEQRLSKGEWTVRNEPVGEMEMRAGYAAMSKRDQDATMPKIEDTQRLMADDGDRIVHLAVIVMKDRSGPPALISAVERLGRANRDAFRASRVYRLARWDLTNFTPMRGKADIARKLVYDLRFGDRSWTYSSIRVARGRVWVELFTQGFRVPDSKAAAVIEELFKRLPIKD